MGCLTRSQEETDNVENATSQKWWAVRSLGRRLKEDTEKQTEGKRDEGKVNGNEELEVILISNREPTVEQLDSGKEVVRVRRWWCCFDSCNRRQNKESCEDEEKPVNVPFAEWKGPVECRMVKKVEKWSRHHVTTEKEQRNSRSTHEALHQQWRLSCDNHLARRVAQTKSTFRVWGCYCRENLVIKCSHPERPFLTSIYTVTTMKYRRPKKSKPKCDKCSQVKWSK